MKRHGNGRFIYARHAAKFREILHSQRIILLRDYKCMKENSAYLHHITGHNGRCSLHGLDMLPRKGTNML